MKLPALILAAGAALTVLAFALTRPSPGSPQGHRPPPIRTNAELARRIAAHDRAAGGGSGVFGPVVHVTCRPVASHGTWAGYYDHRCRETYMAGICIAGSTPEVHVLLVKVRGWRYSTFTDQELDDGDCSVF
jgi:hypothetical protein